MQKKWISLFLMSLMTILTITNPVEAALNRGEFVPSSISDKASGTRLLAYTIKLGDTLWAIARCYNVDMQSLMNVNGLNASSILDIGDALQIPEKNTGIHIVAPGDTIWAIASEYNTSVANIINANSGIDPESLKIGQQLKLTGSARKMIAFQQPSRKSYATTAFSWPVVGAITSAYGWRRDGFHHGVDIAGKIGEPITAAASGVVSFTGNKSVYGKTVIIKHSDGKETLYAHCQRICVSRGQAITQGQQIAYIGITGNSTGPHLHFEVRNAGKTLNPLSLLR